MYVFKMNMNINENIVMFVIFVIFNIFYSVFKKINSVYIMNDDDIFVFMIIFVVKLRCIGCFGILCIKDIFNIMW